MSHKRYLDNSKDVINQICESDIEYVYDDSESINENDEELNIYNPLEYVLRMKVFTLNMMLNLVIFR